MPKLEDFSQFDFSGGIRSDKSDFELQNSELKSGKNFDIDDRGRLVKRRGMVQYGNTKAGGHWDNGVVFIKQTVATPKIDFLTNVRASTGRTHTLVNDNLQAALVALTSTSLDVNSQTLDAASNVVEVEGDLISYTSDVDPRDATAATINSNHAVGAPVHQWHTNSNAGSGAQDFTMGGYYAFLNNLLFVNSRYGANSNSLVYFTNPGDTTFTDVSGEPRILFATTFRDRIYGAGDGSDATDGRTNRIYFSNLADGTSWPGTLTDNSFDVEDTHGDVTGLLAHKTRLLITKHSSMYAFTGSLPLRQISNTVGAYNHRVLKEINDVIYTFCPAGVFANTTNIGEPVKEYLKNFNPTFDANNRVVLNTFAGRYENKYYLYIGNITTPEVLNDVVLVYDTINRRWTVYDNFTGATCFIDTSAFMGSENQIQLRPALFYGNTSVQLFRCFENRVFDGTTVRGSDVYSDNFSDTGSSIVMNVVTKPYDLYTPGTIKQWRHVRVYSETAGIRVSARIDRGDPIELGMTTGGEDRFSFPARARGRRCSLIFDEASQTGPVVLNGFTFEETETITKNA